RGDVIDLQCHDAPLNSQRAKVPSAKPDIGRLARPHYPKIAKKCHVDAIMYGLDPAGDSRCSPARPLPSIGHSWSGTGSLIAATPPFHRQRGKLCCTAMQERHDLAFP